MERTFILFQIISRLYDEVTAKFKFPMMCLRPGFFATSVVIIVFNTGNWKWDSFVTTSAHDEGLKAVRTFRSYY